MGAGASAACAGVAFQSGKLPTAPATPSRRKARRSSFEPDRFSAPWVCVVCWPWRFMESQSVEQCALLTNKPTAALDHQQVGISLWIPANMNGLEVHVAMRPKLLLLETKTYELIDLGLSLVFRKRIVSRIVYTPAILQAGAQPLSARRKVQSYGFQKPAKWVMRPWSFTRA